MNNTSVSGPRLGIAIEHASLRYHDAEQPVLANVNMQIGAGRWTTLLGRSGCGKTTLLRYLAGLLDGQVESQGRFSINGEAGIGDLEHQVAYMAQQDLLFPWLSVLDNVCLSARLQGDKHNPQIRAKALELLEQVGLVAQADALPAQLSGGMRQRVALARTLLQDKPLVLMDEPFSALDAVTRHQLQELAAKLLKDKTVVLITHDPQEALRLSHQIYVLQGQPASANALPALEGEPPRRFNAELAELQENLLSMLEASHV
ncbi:ABC transporter ATP-binding protein [Aliagarivorans marinus]|uniref:ABC transporter ATP-binding protein n=1 Tax=Aliagarivorans marinus TaxID=561965 RepID=UPI0004117A13|nr:ABC transporter ATP-binding protein [Aliagarivorans marinus]